MLVEEQMGLVVPRHKLALILEMLARPANFATYSFLFTDSFLNLTGVFAVEGRALAIHEANRGKEALSGNAVNHNLYVACWTLWIVVS